MQTLLQNELSHCQHSNFPLEKTCENPLHIDDIEQSKMSSIQTQKSSTGKVPPRPEYGVVYVAQEYLPWQKLALTKLRELFNEV